MENAEDWLRNNTGVIDTMNESIPVKKVIEYMEKYALSKPDTESGDLSDFKLFCKFNFPMQSGIVEQLIDSFCGKNNN